MLDLAGPNSHPTAYEGRILFWELDRGWLCLDAVARPASAGPASAEPASAGPVPPAVPVRVVGRFGWSSLALIAAATVQTWADDAAWIGFSVRDGREGATRVRLGSGRTWLVLDELTVLEPAGAPVGAPAART